MVDTGPCRPSAGTPPNNIDTYIVKIGADYHAFTKNEDTKYIEHATATSIDGPWDFGTDVQDWAKWGSHREGPALLDLGNGSWLVVAAPPGGDASWQATGTGMDGPTLAGYTAAFVRVDQ